MEYRSIPDTAITAVDGGILCRSPGGGLDTIDFETCARNYRAAHPSTSARCIGERKMDEGWFVFYTDGVKTRIVFEELSVFNFFRRPLCGSKSTRFLALQRRISRAGYTTRDLS